jgi:(5-formylfuran-3-yl)methyl phosphate transaminase
METTYRRLEITPFLVMEILEEAQRLEAAGHDIVHLEIGEPDFDSPECVRRAATQALDAGDTHYTHSLGILQLREAICEHYWQRYGVVVEPDEVLVTSGTSPALCLLFAAILRPGDEVILTNPHYACYPNFVRFAHGVPVCVDSRADDGYQIRAESVRAMITPRTRAILINSPANPTGAVLSASTLAGLSSLGPLVVSDEIYHGLTYEGEERSALEFGGTGQVCVLNGFSKAYAMTGWRLGYAISSREIVRAMQPLHQSFFISASAFVQRAGIAALREAGPDAARMREEYGRRREYMIRRLSEIGLNLGYVPGGAFYVLADVRRFTSDSLAFAFDLLRQAHVAVTPGIDFGSNAEGHIRLSYSTSIDRIDEGVRRLGEYLRTRG